MASINLFDYQQEALRSVQADFAAGTHRQLICLPTGTGKTILMAAIAKHFNKKILILAHREELIQQAKKKIGLYWKQADIGIVKAEQNEIDHQIVIGSVLTCCRPKRLEQLKKQGFEIFLVDEAHHAVTSTYKRIIDELDFKYNKQNLLIGLTATPERSDSKSLLDVFDKIVFHRSISTMIKAEYLVRVHGRKILTAFSLQGIKTFNGDFAIGELSHAINTPQRNTFVVNKFIEHAVDRKAIAFCSDVKHAQDLATEFNKQGIKSAAVWGDMPSKDRSEVLRNLKHGKISVANSCGVLVEGFDEPSINCVIMARPTKSKSLYIQCVGRGLRKNGPLKTDCLVLDFSDKYHNLDAIVSLSATIPETSMQIDTTKERFFRNENSNEILNADIKPLSDKEFDILGKSRFVWVSLGDGEYSLADDNNSEIIMRPQKNGYVADFYCNGTQVSLVRDTLPIDYCSGVCEDYARRNLKITFADANGWLKNSQNVAPTQGQIQLLQQYNIDCSNMDKSQASLEIRRIIALNRKNKRNAKKSSINQIMNLSYYKNSYKQNTEDLLSKIKNPKIREELQKKLALMRNA